jgi:hypothetical protein
MGGCETLAQVGARRDFANDWLAGGRLQGAAGRGGAPLAAVGIVYRRRRAAYTSNRFMVQKAAGAFNHGAPGAAQLG